MGMIRAGASLSLNHPARANRLRTRSLRLVSALWARSPNRRLIRPASDNACPAGLYSSYELASRHSLLGCPMDGSGVRASAGAPEELSRHGQVSPGTFSQPPGIRRNRTPPMQRISPRCCCSRRSACSRYMRIWAIFASLAGFGSVFGAGIAAVVSGCAGGALKRAFHAFPVFRCSQIPAPAIPSSSTAHKPIHGNSQRGFGSSGR